MGVLEKRRVVVTGLGAITPLGHTVQEFWEGLLAGRSGMGPVTAFSPTKLTTRIAAEVKDFDAGAVLGREESRRMDRYAQFAMVAAREAWADARLPDDPDVRARTGVIIASGIGGIITVEETTLSVRPSKRLGPHLAVLRPQADGQRRLGQVSIRWGLRGPAFAIARLHERPTRSATPTRSSGRGRAVVTGGSEATASRMGGFPRCAPCRPATTTRPTPAARSTATATASCSPRGPASWSSRSRARAPARGARIYAEVLGYGMAADGYHITAPDRRARARPGP